MTALILEGGGMRGLFTSGALDAFLDADIQIPRCYGVSAGACNAISYYTGQRGRSRAININYVNDKRYVSWENLLDGGCIFSEEMMFHTIPEKLLPFDYDRYRAVNPDSFAVCTSLLSGRPVYIRVPADLRAEYRPILASMSLPLVSRPVEYKGDLLLDGGVADSIPVARALKDGTDKLVIILTQHDGYQKQAEKMLPMYRIWYHDYPSFIRAISRRHIVYNQSLELIRQLEQQGKAVVIRPPQPVDISRIEKDTRKLNALYQQGYNTATAKIAELREFLGQ